MLISLLIALMLTVTPDDRADAVREAAEAVLATSFPEDVHRLEVSVRRVDGEFTAEQPISITFPEMTAMPRGTTRVSVFTGNDEAGWREAGWAMLYVAHFDSVLIAHETLPADEPVTMDQLSTAWMETTRFPGEPLTPTAFTELAADGEVLADRLLRADRVLRTDDLRPPYLVTTGDRVAMRYRRGAVVFELTCKAREPGGRTDEIRLYSDDTGRMYRARLTGPGTADWIETL